MKMLSLIWFFSLIIRNRNFVWIKNNVNKLYFTPCCTTFSWTIYLSIHQLLLGALIAKTRWILAWLSQQLFWFPSTPDKLIQKGTTKLGANFVRFFITPQGWSLRSNQSWTALFHNFQVYSFSQRTSVDFWLWKFVFSALFGYFQVTHSAESDTSTRAGHCGE